MTGDDQAFLQDASAIAGTGLLRSGIDVPIDYEGPGQASPPKSTRNSVGGLQTTKVPGTLSALADGAFIDT